VKELARADGVMSVGVMNVAAKAGMRGADGNRVRKWWRMRGPPSEETNVPNSS
jgi:hypothetical protein